MLQMVTQELEASCRKADLPARWGGRLQKIEPVGMFLVLGCAVMRWLDWLFEPAFKVLGRIIVALLGVSA